MILAAAAVRGRGHRQRRQPCQDAIRAAVDQKRAVAVVCDGAGSAPHGGIGAATLAETTCIALLEHGLPAEAGAWWAVLGRGLEAVDRAATSRGARSRRELATTWLALVVDGERAGAAQIGDGFIVIDAGAGYELLFPPDKGAYPNETRFATGCRPGDLRCRQGPAPAFAALGSDGLEHLALDRADQRPYAGFFRPLERHLSDGGTSQELAAFLASARVDQRSDDDRSLALLARPPA